MGKGDTEIGEYSKDSDCNTKSIIPDVSLLFSYGKKGLVMGNQENKKVFLGWLKDLESKVENEDATFKDIENEIGHLINYAKMLYALEIHLPNWSYVGGFTGSDGRVKLRNVNCGHEKEVSLITVRHMKDGADLECDVCTQLRLQKIREERAKRVQVKKAKRILYGSSNKEQCELKECPQCGAFYFGFEKDKFCSVQCKEKCQKRNINRYKETKRKKCRTEESKYINLEAVYKRDKGVCWLCGKPCDITLDSNDNYYPSIDHVFPIAKGGKDTWDNVRLAHRICNTIKNDKTDLAQVKRAIDMIPRSIF